MRMWANLLLVLASTAVGQKQPTISYISGAGSGEVVTDLGKSAELMCQVKNGKEYPINWIKISGDKKDDYFPLSTGKTLVIRDARFNLSSEAQQDSLSTTLRINNIENIDAAIYQCQVIVGIGNKITKEVRLRVKTPVVILADSTESLTVVEGEEARLECSVGGFPAPTITWERVDRRVFHSGAATVAGAVLVIPSAVRGDRGKYRCTAENSVGEPQSHQAELTVRFGPSVRVPRPRLQQALGYDVILQCEIEALPAPSISWIKAGEGEEQVLDSSGQYTVAHFNRGPTTTRSTLRVAGLTQADFGTYTCRAKNTHGSVEGALELTETNIPIPEAAFAGVEKKTSFVSVVLSSLLIALTLL